MTAFEFKASRGDWLKELRTPEKADGIVLMVHEFYVVAEPKIVDKGEVPETWGLIERKGGRLYTTKKAPWRKVEPPDFLFLASIMRQLHNSYEGMFRNHVHRDSIKKELAAATELAKEDVKYELSNYKRLQEKVKEFEEASGVEIQAWDRKEVGAAVRLIVNSGSDLQGQVRKARELLQEQVESMGDLLKALNENGEKP